MKYQLRSYQTAAVTAAVDFLKKDEGVKGGLLVLPTGAGKSLVIADIAAQLDAPVVILQPSKEILEQNYKKMISYGILQVAIFSASFNSKNISQITFATIGSVISKMQYFKHFKYCIIDECHNVNHQDGMYKEFIEGLNMRIVGLTATPYRLYSSRNYGSMLRFLTRVKGRIFSKLLYACQVSELVNAGYLSRLKYYDFFEFDRSKLKLNTMGNDYTDKSVQNFYKQINFANKIHECVYRLIYNARVPRRGILVFTRFKDEAASLIGLLPRGIGAMVSGDTPATLRAQILKDFKEGKIKVVANVGVLTTGFDYPELDTVVLARPTMSLSLYYQMVGRAIRRYEGKEAWIVDLCGNYKRFGKVEDLELKDTAPGKGLWAYFSKDKQLTNIFFN